MMRELPLADYLGPELSAAFAEANSRSAAVDAEWAAIGDDTKAVAGERSAQAPTPRPVADSIATIKRRRFENAKGRACRATKARTATGGRRTRSLCSRNAGAGRCGGSPTGSASVARGDWFGGNYYREECLRQSAVRRVDRRHKRGKSRLCGQGWISFAAKWFPSWPPGKETRRQSRRWLRNCGKTLRRRWPLQWRSVWRWAPGPAGVGIRLLADCWLYRSQSLWRLLSLPVVAAVAGRPLSPGVCVMVFFGGGGVHGRRHQHYRRDSHQRPTTRRQVCVRKPTRPPAIRTHGTKCGAAVAKIYADPVACSAALALGHGDCGWDALSSPSSGRHATRSRYEAVAASDPAAALRQIVFDRVGVEL